MYTVIEPEGNERGWPSPIAKEMQKALGEVTSLPETGPFVNLFGLHMNPQAIREWFVLLTEFIDGKRHDFQTICQRIDLFMLTSSPEFWALRKAAKELAKR